MILVLVLIITGSNLFAEKKLPVIRANSKMVDVRAGNSFHKGDWKISPEAKPDIYTTSLIGEKITFYTDLDSISVKINSKTKFDFIILLNDTIEALTEITYKPGYLDILKTASEYNHNDARPVPKFIYQSQDDPNLVKLRAAFKLDSIAGGGNEVSRILNLLLWVHNLIPHDGNHDNPAVKNSLSMVKICKNGNRGLNCRGLATILNECYLSMGIPSRIVTCMPKDSIFNDCHVINMVYSFEHKKWLWIDPTNFAYVMNERGELLSIEEVRERIIRDLPLILNPDANWNHKATETKEEYLYNYMAKNLFRLESPLESEFDYETWKSGKEYTYVELISLNAFNQLPQKSVKKDTATGVTHNYYKTNKPEIFWAAPEMKSSRK